MSQNIFEIENLECSYNKCDVVLKIEKLDIPRGKMVVLLGVSGAGKSTFLETLGLMNNTVLSAGKFNFLTEDDNTIPFENLWKTNDNNISLIRNKYFSFIFQNTNLMNNFTVYENICLTQMLQGKSRKESIDNIRGIMSKIGLEQNDSNGNIVNLMHKKPFELSGGQRQRVAFVRAFTPEFSVLFADEPTGNLDVYNSKALMDILKNSILEPNRTAIIVTHSLTLAMEYADLLVILSKKNNCGEIKRNNIFVSQTTNTTKLWSSIDGISIPDINCLVSEAIKN